ncbi:hypothetical protein KY363_07115 [Candidatus Woesearchaeota archaeon]|nr:hypothetical protein [Candidatus Woesearchaeota archaeon]
MLQQTKTTEVPFVGRDSILSQLEQSVSKKRITAVLAPSGFGRSALLKQFGKKHDALYLDLRKLSLSPESFAVEFMGTVCFLMLGKKAGTLHEFLSVDRMKTLKLGKACADIISTVDNELQKIKPSQELIVSSALRFADEMCSETKKPRAILLNNFEEILKLNNFSGINDVLDIFFGIATKNRSTGFILASSAVQLVRNSLKSRQVDVAELPAFSLEETRELFEAVAGKSDERIIKEVYQSSAGIPTIVRRIALRFREEKKADTQKSIALIRHILISDLATTTSHSYVYCSRLLADSLNRARGETLLKAILKAVSQNRPLRLTEIARMIYRSGPVTKSLLERLVEVDLIRKTDNTFDFSNPVLKEWCRLMFTGIEFSEIPDEQVLVEIGEMK